MDKSWLIPCGIITVLLVGICAVCVLTGAVIGASYWVYIQAGVTPVVSYSTPVPYATPTPSPVVLRPTPPTETPTPTPEPTLAPSDTPTDIPSQPVTAAGVPLDTLLTLQQVDIPINDPLDIARRLLGLTNLPATVEPPAAYLQVGNQQTFWISNGNDESTRVSATLQYVTEHTYFWIEDGVRFNQSDLRALAEAFENEIYPTTRAFFGSEWTPGVDGDPHIYILYATGIGDQIAGYFSSAEEYPPQINEFSNSHEMFFINADNSPLDDEYTYGVLAHEFQHMIHWYQDRNETSWMNEGFSELAVLLNGYDPGGFDMLYTSDPDLQLNNWPDDSNEDTSPHYGASFLFMTYFLDRFGNAATQALVAHPENDLDSIDLTLAEFGFTDALTGLTITADDVFLDWAITNYLNDGRVGDGRYTYRSYRGISTADPNETYTACPVDTITHDVHQYGVDYLRFTCQGSYTLHFEGSIQVGVIPSNPLSGVYAYWSNKSDESDMTLTRTFDFSAVSSPLTLTYWTWYDIEEDYDYIYLLASLDGERWQILTTPSGTSSDPTGANYGWGYNGQSGGGSKPEWIQETIDISQYAGRIVQLRFEYITDSSVSGEGFLLDDIAVPEIGYFSDFEADHGGWEASGWVRMQNVLPQYYRLALISMGSTTTIQYITLNSDITADIPFTIGGDVDEVVLVVTATTRYTRQLAPYRFSVIQP